MSTPVVVQGTPVVQGKPVSDPYADQYAYNDQPTQTATNNVNVTWSKGEKQATRCRDPLFAVILYVNVIAMVAVAAKYGPKALKGATSNKSNTEYDGYIYLVVVTAVISFVFSGLAMVVLMRIPEFLIKTSLIFTVVMSGIWAALSFAVGNVVGGIIGLIFFALSVCYAFAVWSRIPFATINLITGCTAIRNNCGVTFLAYLLTIVAIGWSILWSIAFVGLWDSTQKCKYDAQTNQQVCSVNYGILFVLFISYFFTHQVLQNCVHTTIAGVTGTWWFTPEDAKGCCTSGVINSTIRTLTTSFGSICFGSLVVAILRALEQLAQQARANDEAGIGACIAECILSCLASLVEYLNKWGFIYVGIYGYGYIEACKNVFTLFRDRGWDAIVADNLVGNTLGLLSLIVGGVMGGIALLLNNYGGFFKNKPHGESEAAAFVLGFVIGLVICSILMSTIGSSVDAVIVLFAEAPNEFEQNYPDLSRRMRETWRATFPGCI